MQRDTEQMMKGQMEQLLCDAERISDSRRQMTAVSLTGNSQHLAQCRSFILRLIRWPKNRI